MHLRIKVAVINCNKNSSKMMMMMMMMMMIRKKLKNKASKSLKLSWIKEKKIDHPLARIAMTYLWNLKFTRALQRIKTLLVRHTHLSINLRARIFLQWKSRQRREL